MTIDLTNMTEKEKIKFCLLIAEKAEKYLNNKKTKALIELALKRCWKWLENKCDIAEELYDYLDNDENSFNNISRE